MISQNHTVERNISCFHLIKVGRKTTENITLLHFSFKGDFLAVHCSNIVEVISLSSQAIRTSASELVVHETRIKDYSHPFLTITEVLSYLDE